MRLKKINKEARSILTKTEEGKKLLYLLEEAPRTLTMQGLPKIHKPGVPLRPITLGIGSPTHRLPKVLAPSLVAALRKINFTHLKNLSDRQEKREKVNFKGRRVVNFHVKSLFTNAQVDGAMNAAMKAL